MLPLLTYFVQNTPSLCRQRAIKSLDLGLNASAIVWRRRSQCSRRFRFGVIESIGLCCGVCGVSHGSSQRWTLPGLATMHHLTQIPTKGMGQNAYRTLGPRKMGGPGDKAASYLTWPVANFHLPSETRRSHRPSLPPLTAPCERRPFSVLPYIWPLSPRAQLLC